MWQTQLLHTLRRVRDVGMPHNKKFILIILFKYNFSKKKTNFQRNNNYCVSNTYKINKVYTNSGCNIFLILFLIKNDALTFNIT